MFEQVVFFRIATFLPRKNKLHLSQLFEDFQGGKKIMANDPVTPPRRPHVNGLSMTEYSSIPTPKTERSEEVVRDSCKSVPDDYILPTGYPDVRKLLLLLTADRDALTN